jgi:hypothetical protein
MGNRTLHSLGLVSAHEVSSMRCACRCNVQVHVIDRTIGDRGLAYRPVVVRIGARHL